MQERKGSCPERVRSFGEGEEVEVGKESTTVSTFENGGEASLCPTTHMPSSQETRAPRRSINQRHVVSCGDGERANGRMKGPVGGKKSIPGRGGWRGPSDEGQVTASRMGVQTRGEMLPSVVCATLDGNSGNHAAFFLGSPPHFCLLFGQGTAWANRGGQCSVTTCPRTMREEVTWR